MNDCLVNYCICETVCYCLKTLTILLQRVQGSPGRGFSIVSTEVEFCPADVLTANKRIIPFLNNLKLTQEYASNVLKTKNYQQNHKVTNYHAVTEAREGLGVCPSVLPKINFIIRLNLIGKY